MRRCAEIVDRDYIAPMQFFPPARTLHASHCTPQDSGRLLLLSQYNMEVAPCVQEVSSHAASLLAGLNLQRERAQFCDCVLTQRQNPGQLYPAHRCVLSASSPVLAAILSSTGALVELQAPSLSDSVLALLLDYIYTGALPYTPNQQQYYNLLSAACYLQMDELQETLRSWHRTEVNAADNTNAFTGAEKQNYKDINSTYSKTGNTCSKYLPLSHSCSVNSLEKEDRQYYASVDTGNCRQMTHLTPQDLVQNILCTPEVHSVSRLDIMQNDRLHSAGPEAPETWPRSTEEDIVRTVEDRRSLYLSCTAEVLEEETGGAEKRQRLCLAVKSKAEEKQTDRKENDRTQVHHSPLVSPSQCSSSSSSPHRCCTAVPVIRHSSRAAMFQLAEVSTMPPHHSVSQALVNSSRTPDSKPGVLKQDYNSSKTDCCIRQNDEHVGNGLSHITDHDDHRDARCDSFRSKNNTTHLSDDSGPQNKDCSKFTRGLKYKTDLSFDDFPCKHQRLDCSDDHNVSMATAAQEQSIHSQDPRAVAPLPVQNPDTGSDSHSEELFPEGEAKEEHSYSSSYPAVMDRRDSHCPLYGSKTDRYPAHTSTQDAAPSQYEHDSDHRRSVDALELENISGPEITEPHSPFTMLVDNNMSDPTCSVVGQSYRGHLHYHCLPQEDIYFSHGASDYKHSHRSHSDHPDQSSDEEEVGTLASPGCSPLRQDSAKRTTDQVLLLDISAQPAELLVSYKHRSDEGEKWVAFNNKDTFGNGFGNNDRGQWNQATSVTGVNEKKSRAMIKFEAESCDEAETKSWVGETKVEERKSVGTDQSLPGAEVVHRAGVMDGEHQTTTLTVCSAPSVPDSVQASMASTLSVCIPSALSASVQTNISAHLSTPVAHPFQCSLCDRSFSQRGSLNRHVRSHLGVRPFPCPRCPMTFSRQYRVMEHMRVHQRCALGSDFQKPPASSI